MGWPAVPPVSEVVRAARGYVHDALEGETVLTVGASLHAWRRREVDAVLSVGPLECMPNKLAETQLVHAGEAEGLLSLTLSLQGDPIDPEPLDAFAFEVQARFRKRRHRCGPCAPPAAPAREDAVPAVPEEVPS
jgi:hypothetical protein